MPQINASLPSSPHRNRTPTLFDCCVMPSWLWFMPVGVPYSNIYPHTDVKNIRFVYKNWRSITKPPPTIAIAAKIPSMGCKCAGNKRVVAEVAIGMSGDRVIGDTSRILTIVVGWWTVGVGYVYGLWRHHRATRLRGRVTSSVSVGGVEYALHRTEQLQWLWQ